MEEPSAAYEFSKIKVNGIDRTTFDFDAEFKSCYTLEEAKATSIKRIWAW